MKRYALLILSAGSFALTMFCFWYTDVLFNRFFVLGLIPPGVALTALVGCAVMSVYKLIRGIGRWISGISLLICILAVIVSCVFPFRMTRVKVELDAFAEDRLHIVELIADEQLSPDGLGNVRLPLRYRRTSSDGTVLVYRNDYEQVICFWVFRGMFSGSTQLMYSSQDESLIWNIDQIHPIIHVEQLKEHWYLVETDY